MVMASRTLERLTLNMAASSRSGGRRSPARSRPASRASKICWATYWAFFWAGRGLNNGTHPFPWPDPTARRGLTAQGDGAAVPLAEAAPQAGFDHQETGVDHQRKGDEQEGHGQNARHVVQADGLHEQEARPLAGS